MMCAEVYYSSPSLFLPSPLSLPPPQQCVIQRGEELILSNSISDHSIRERSSQLQALWVDLREASSLRGQRLKASVAYQEYCVGIDEEEVWLNEKMALALSEEMGDTLAAVQVGVASSCVGAVL